MNPKAQHGIYAAAISPFDEKLHLDVYHLTEYCKFLLTDGGCDGVAPCGTTGEGLSISFCERLQIAKAFSKASIASDQVILGTGCSALGDTICLTRNAMEHGYNNVLVLPPYYYKYPDEEGIYEYYMRISDAVEDSALRIYLYHFPQMSKVPITRNLVLKLRSHLGERLAGLKDSSGDFNQTLDFVEATGGKNANFDVFPSSEAFLHHALEAGCAGIISGSTNAFATLVQSAMTAPNESQDNLYNQISEARNTAMEYPLIAAMKFYQSLRSNNDAWLRILPPLKRLEAQQEQELKQKFIKYL